MGKVHVIYRADEKCETFNQFTSATRVSKDCFWIREYESDGRKADTK